MDKCFIAKSHVPNVYRFNARFRDCLLSLGKSPDMHVYEMDDASMRFVRMGEEYRFVMSVVTFYNGLDSILKKRIFLTEFVERGRHYPFWHYEMIDTGVYKEMVEEVYQEFHKAFMEGVA